MSSKSDTASEFFEEESFGLLANLEDGHFWFEERNLLIESLLRRHFPERGRFLEIGCGTGFVLRHLQGQFPETDFSGIEYFDEGLEFARDRLEGAKVEQGDARDLDAKWQGVDAIGIFDVLEHIKEDEEVLAEMYRVLAGGGGAVITVPQHQWLWSHSDDFACHVRRYTRRELVEKAKAAGFEIEMVSSFVFFLLPMMLVSRLLQRRKKLEDVDFSAEFEVNPLVNRILRFVLRVERKLISWKLSLPVGGSLVMVVRKR